MALLNLFIYGTFLGLLSRSANARPALSAFAAGTSTLLIIFMASGEWPSLKSALLAIAAMIGGGTLGLLLHSLLPPFRRGDDANEDIPSQ